MVGTSYCHKLFWQENDFASAPQEISSSRMKASFSFTSKTDFPWWWFFFIGLIPWWWRSVWNYYFQFFRILFSTVYFLKEFFHFFSRNYYPEAIFKHVSLYYMWCRRQWLSLWSISISFGVNLELEWGNKAMILYLRTHHIWIELWIELKSDVFLYLSSYQKDNSFLSRFPTVKWK